MRNRKIEVFGILTRYTLLILTGLLFLFPFLWMLSGSIKTLGSYYVRPPELIPANPAWKNYLWVLERINLERHTLNSIIVAGSISFLQFVTSSTAAFAFAALRFPGKKILFSIVLGTLMIPATVVLIPLFKVVHAFGLVNTYAGLIIPFMFTGFGIFLLRQFFLSLPKDLFAAATVDGASYFRIFSTIYIPLALPGFATLITLAFISHFNQLLWPLIITSTDSMMVLAVRLVSFISFDRTMEPDLIMAAAAVCVVPSLVIFVAFQRLYVRGYVMSGLKG
jgi:multiple sugar transport system permease protein